MKHTLARLSTLALLLIVLIVPLATFASEGSQTFAGNFPNPLGAGSTLETVIANIFKYLVQIATVIVPIMVVIGAFQMLMSSGDPGKFKKGRDTIMWALIGFAVLLMAFGIADIVKTLLKG